MDSPDLSGASDAERQAFMQPSDSDFDLDVRIELSEPAVGRGARIQAADTEMSCDQCDTDYADCGVTDQGDTCDATCPAKDTCQGNTCEGSCDTCAGDTCDTCAGNTCQGSNCVGTCGGMTCEGTCAQDDTCVGTCGGQTCDRGYTCATCVGPTCDQYTCMGGNTCEGTCPGDNTCVGTCAGLTCDDLRLC
jgi:hypothetical protein